MPKLSDDKANPKKMASFGSIKFELLKSKSLCFPDFFSKIDFIIINNPIINNIKQPISSVIYFGKKFSNIVPEKTDMKDTSSEIKNNIIVLKNEIFFFFIPYVTPIPSESMLLEIAKIKQFKSIAIPPVYNMQKFDKSLEILCKVVNLDIL